MWDKILNLPSSTSPAVRRSVLEIQKSHAEINEEKNIDGEANIRSPTGLTANKTGEIISSRFTDALIISKILQ